MKSAVALIVTRRILMRFISLFYYLTFCFSKKMVIVEDICIKIYDVIVRFVVLYLAVL